MSTTPPDYTPPTHSAPVVATGANIATLIASHEATNSAVRELAQQVADIPTSGSSNLLVVSGSVALDNGVAVGTLVGYRATASTTFTGQGGSVALAAGVHIFERVAGGWTYRTIDEGTGLTPPAPDTTNPTAGTLGVTGVTDVAATLTVTGASDDQALHGAPYAFSTNNGSTWTGWQSSNVYAASGLAASTTYQGRHKVRDTSGNEATGTAQGFTTAAAPLPTGPVSATHLYSGENAALTAGQSYTGVPLGVAHANRLIVVASIARRTAGRFISAATIGGVTATPVNTGVSANAINFAYAVVPTGTTGDIDLTFSGGLDQGGSIIDVFEVVNTVKTHSASLAQEATAAPTAPATPLGGLALFYLARGGSTVEFSITGGTEVIDYNTTHGRQIAAATAEATGSPVTITVEGTPTPSVAGIVFDKAV